MSDYVERELGWDDEISRESEFILLPEGDYNFKVTGFERARHEGSENLPPCSKAIVTLEINSPEGSVYLKHNLFLHTKCEGLLSAFFIGIGLKKHGEPLKMNWNAVIGTKGRCKLGIRTWISTKTGEEMKSNEVKRFYPPDTPAEPQTVSSTKTATVTGVYTPGKF